MTTCELCHQRGPDVTPAVVKWRTGVPPYSSVERCRDHDACWRRVKAAGEPWPVDDRRTGLRLMDERP